MASAPSWEQQVIEHLIGVQLQAEGLLAQAVPIVTATDLLTQRLVGGESKSPPFVDAGKSVPFEPPLLVEVDNRLSRLSLTLSCTDSLLLYEVKALRQLLHGLFNTPFPDDNTVDGATSTPFSGPSPGSGPDSGESCRCRTPAQHAAIMEILSGAGHHDR